MSSMRAVLVPGLGSSLDHTKSFRLSLLCSAQGSLEKLHLIPHQLTVQLTAMEVNDKSPLQLFVPENIVWPKVPMYDSQGTDFLH